MGLYPTIELVTDQEKQVRDYYNQFDPDEFAQLDSLYGAELARRVEEPRRAISSRLWLSLKQKHVILTNRYFFTWWLTFVTEPCLQPDRVAARLGKKPRFIRC